jgi:hypothetical protein
VELRAVEELPEDLRDLRADDPRAVVLDRDLVPLGSRLDDLDDQLGENPASSQASRELSTASLMAVSSAFCGLSKPRDVDSS